MKRTRSSSLRHKSKKTPVRKSGEGATRQVRKSAATDQWVGADTIRSSLKSLSPRRPCNLGPSRFSGGDILRVLAIKIPSGIRHSWKDLILNSNGIRVLPIAQQTNNVAGHRDGLRNGAAIVSSFGQIYLSNLADGTLVFLDVEGPPNPSLSILALFSIVPLTILGKGQMALY
jgi:hypothetical protein